MKIESSHVFMSEGYSSLEAIEVVHEEVVFNLSLNSNHG